MNNNKPADEYGDDNDDKWEPLDQNGAASSIIIAEENTTNNVDIPFSDLARMSREVYGSLDEEGNNIAIEIAQDLPSGSDIIHVGADRFSYCIQSKTLFVSICGTFHAAQHMMNVMPHLATGLNVARHLMGHGKDNIRNIPNAYDSGFHKGWMEPALRIYNEFFKHFDRDLNHSVDTVYLTGHSRGGLLAYYVGWLFATEAHFGGNIQIVGFGMPPPQKNPTFEESEFIKRAVTAVINRNDPVANEAFIKCFKNWYPKKIVVGKEKIKPEPAETNQEPSQTSGGGSLWGLVRGTIQTAVSAVGDTINEIRQDIETYHSIDEYEMEVSTFQNGSKTSISNC